MAILVVIDVVVLFILSLIDATRLKTETRYLQREVRTVDFSNNSTCTCVFGKTEYVAYSNSMHSCL